MSIPTCRHCKRTYWRYRSDFPPAGYCSLPHAELGPAKRERGAPKPLKPNIVLDRFRFHRIAAHGDRFFLQDYDDCADCDSFRALYVESMAYWMDHPLWEGMPQRSNS